MSTPIHHIVLLGVKRTVIAFDKHTGERLWTRELSSGLSGDFVTVLADHTRAFAHTHGEMFCLDLRTGAVLWKDELSGLGYGVASIAFAGSALSSSPALAAKVQQEKSDAAVISATAGS